MYYYIQIPNIQTDKLPFSMLAQGYEFYFEPKSELIYSSLIIDMIRLKVETILGIEIETIKLMTISKVQIDKKDNICRVCGGNGVPSTGIVNFHNIQTLDKTKEFTTKQLPCLKCEKCGHSWIPKDK